MRDERFKIIRKLSWEEVFLFWYQNEGESESWNELARERGYASWAEWRLKGYAERFECASADWGLYEVSEPAKVFSSFYGGPFRTWIEKYYKGEKIKTFAELAKDSEIRKKEAVQSMQKSFPSDKVICCLDVQGKIFVIEGMHRACALGVMNLKGQDLDQPLLVAVGKSKLKELTIVGQKTAK